MYKTHTYTMHACAPPPHDCTHTQQKLHTHTHEYMQANMHAHTHTHTHAQSLPTCLLLFLSLLVALFILGAVVRLIDVVQQSGVLLLVQALDALALPQ